MPTKKKIKQAHRGVQSLLTDVQMVRARYDAAQTNTDNVRHWAAADALSSVAAHSEGVRRLVRNRSRYESANNSYLAGILRTLVNDVVGTQGPRLQMLTGTEWDSKIEGAWARQARLIKLATKLRIMRRARAVDGEVFSTFLSNPKLASDVKLDVRLVEADQVHDPVHGQVFDPAWDDGIHFDEQGNPITYRMLRQHPGDIGCANLSMDWTDQPASMVRHYFLAERPGQRRGIPEILSGLSIFPDLRRFGSAVLGSAESVAEFAMMLYSEAPADTESTSEYAALAAFPIEKRMATVVPAGMKVEQLKAEQPTTTYGDFVNKKLAEAARCINMPFTIAALDSSQSNLSARYLDSQIYAKAILIDRFDLEIEFLDPTLDEFMMEFLKFRESDNPRKDFPEEFPHIWTWDSTGEHADPGKVADAKATKLKTGQITLAEVIANDNRDWEEVQIVGAKSLGVSVEKYQELVRNGIFNIQPVQPQNQPKQETE